MPSLHHVFSQWFLQVMDSDAAVDFFSCMNFFGQGVYLQLPSHHQDSILGQMSSILQYITVDSGKMGVYTIQKSKYTTKR